MTSTYHDSLGLWKDLLKKGFDDDAWQWDWTTLGTQNGQRRVQRAKIVAKSEGVWAADGLCADLGLLTQELGMPLKLRTFISDGQRLKPGMKVMEWSGPVRMILAAERPFLNLASFVGGIATETRKLVDQVQRAWDAQKLRSGKPPRVTATRKTLPGYRDLAVLGVRAGGGWSHRVSLSGGILIKENHIASAGGIRRAIEGVRMTAPHGLKIEIEVRSLKELDAALGVGVDGVLLDNFSPSEVKQAVTRIQREPVPVFVEVSGGLNEKTISDYVLPGVHVLSSGSLTHSVKAIDLSLLMSSLRT